MAAGTYSSIFIATPFLAHLKSKEAGVQEQEKRIKTRRRHDADRYANVPAYTDDMPIAADPGLGRGRRRPRRPPPPRSGGNRPLPTTGAIGRGRVVPQARGPVKPSSASGRAQPARKPKSKRGKK